MTYGKTSTLFTISFILFTAALLILLPVAGAATFTVNTTNDTVDANPGDGLAEDASGACSLRAAIMEANALAGADIITVPAGTYTLAIATTYENAAADGDLDITDDLTIDGAGAGSAIVDGGGIDRVFHCPVEGVSITINNLTIQNGYRDDNACPVINLAAIGDGGNSGGGIWSAANVNLNYCIVQDNHTYKGEVYGSSAGGIRLLGASGTMIIQSCAVVNNSTNHAGGGIKNEDSTLTLINTTVSGNSSDNYTGGVHTGCDATTTFDHCTIVNNTTNSIGLTGGHAAGISGIGSVTLTNTIVANNVSGAGERNDCSGNIISQGYNLIEDTADCTITGDTTGNITGQDPVLGPLANNGGDTLTHALLAGSPATNLIPSGSCSQATDQRGEARPSGAGCDIGAFELQEDVQPEVIPTLSQWGAIIFILLMAGTGIMFMRRKNSTA